MLIDSSYLIFQQCRSSKELKDLRRECEIQRDLCHPNIIQMLDSFETADEMILVTEYAPGDLHKLLAREGSMGEERAQKLTWDLVSALYYLHSHRILHRDLKPENILLDKNQMAKLCDFGFARNMTLGNHFLTSMKGTPLYMAPEVMHEKPYDHQADLWSLGCIIYEVLTGHPPFPTNAFSRLLQLIKQEDVKWPSFISMECLSFLQGLLEKDPTLRTVWSVILNHAFVRGHVLILNENIPESPFTHPLTASQSLEKERQAVSIMRDAKQQSPGNANNFDSTMLPLKGFNNDRAVKLQNKCSPNDDLVSSRDSINAILQSDLENIETDYEELGAGRRLIVLPENIINEASEKALIDEMREERKKRPLLGDKKASAKAQSISADHLNAVPAQHVHDTNAKRNSVQEIACSLSQLQLAKAEDGGPIINPPDVLPGWDSCEELAKSLSIENDEWLAFIHRFMQEVMMDGELDSLKQQNLVSMIVAPLRNSKASCRVVESVAQLLSLPLVLGGSPGTSEEIRNVYIGVKLVPNLVYASKLLCHRRQYLSDKKQGNVENCTPSAAPSPQNMTQPIRLCSNLSEILTDDDLKALSTLYELVCHLIHLNDAFLTQFCDALVILRASNLLVQFIAGGKWRRSFGRGVIQCSGRTHGKDDR